MRRQYFRQLGMETLEDRNMLAVGFLDNGWLGVLGTKASDNIQIQMAGNRVQVTDNGVVRSFSGVPTVAIHCLAGDDQITVNNNVTIPVWIDGGKGNDTIQGGSGNDAISAWSGNDTILGGAGDDILFGDSGHDNIQGGTGDDVVSGGKGNDVIHGGDGDDLISGDAGRDEVYGEIGNDLCVGAGGSDFLDGGAGLDELIGEGGVDWIYGGADADFIDGGRGKDNCYGGDGDDRLKGGSGLDQLNGESGQNLLDKDKGKDNLSNGIEADLDLELKAQVFGPGGSSGTATHELVNDNGVLISRFRLEMVNLPAHSTVDVVIDNVVVGQIESDGSGAGVLVYSTAPTSNELLFSIGFPSVRKGSTIAIGGAFETEFIGTYFAPRPIALPALP